MKWTCPSKWTAAKWYWTLKCCVSSTGSLLLRFALFTVSFADSCLFVWCVCFWNACSVLSKQTPAPTSPTQVLTLMRSEIPSIADLRKLYPSRSWKPRQLQSFYDKIRLLSVDEQSLVAKMETVTKAMRTWSDEVIEDYTCQICFESRPDCMMMLHCQLHSFCVVCVSRLATRVLVAMQTRQVELETRVVRMSIKCPICRVACISGRYDLIDLHFVSVDTTHRRNIKTQLLNTALVELGLSPVYKAPWRCPFCNKTDFDSTKLWTFHTHIRQCMTRNFSCKKELTHDSRCDQLVRPPHFVCPAHGLEGVRIAS